MVGHLNIALLRLSIVVQNLGDNGLLDQPTEAIAIKGGHGACSVRNRSWRRFKHQRPCIRAWLPFDEFVFHYYRKVASLPLSRKG